MSRDQQADFKQLKRTVKKVAEAADIPMELVAPRKRLEKLMQDRTLEGNPFFQGWRGELLAPVRSQIEDILKQ